MKRLLMLSCGALALAAIWTPAVAQDNDNGAPIHHKSMVSKSKQWSKHVNHQTNRASKHFNHMTNRVSKNMNHFFQGKNRHHDYNDTTR